MRFLMVLMMSVILIGCSENQDVVDQKSVGRWQALVDKDYEKAYSYFSESYQKIEDLNTYRLRIATAQINTQWQSASFINKTCEEKSCQVEVDLKYKYVFPKASMGSVESTVRLVENWVDEDGVWKLIPSAQQDLQQK